MFVRKRPNVNLPIHMELNEVAKFELHREAALSGLRISPPGAVLLALTPDYA